jgi:hypothetical protein
LWSFEFISFSDSQFGLVVEDKEDVVIAPWYVFDFSKVRIVTAVRMNFALFGGDVTSEVATTSSSLLWFDHSTSVQVQGVQVDKIKILTRVDSGWQLWNVWSSNGGEGFWVDLSGGGQDQRFLHFFWGD